MMKWMSRTYWLVIGVISLVTVLLIRKYVTDDNWVSVTTMCVLAWVGNDVAAKWNKTDIPK